MISFAICKIAANNKIIIFVVLFLITTELLLFNLAAFKRLNLKKYFEGIISKDEYLSKPKNLYPKYCYNVIRWLNVNLDNRSKILFVGESRAYYCDKNFISYSVELNKQPLMEFIKKSRNADELLNQFKLYGITHILINYAEAMRVNTGYKTFYWNHRDREVFKAFWNKHITIEYSYKEAFLYKINFQEINQTPAINILEHFASSIWKDI